MLILGMSACLVWSAHFFLLGAVTGAAMNLLAAGRSYVYYRIKPSKKNRWVLWLFIALVAGATALTWQGLISLLPFLGLTSGSIAYWQQKPKHIRRYGLAASPPWFIYNLISGSYPGVLAEVLIAASNLIGQYRYDFKKPLPRRKLIRAARPI